MARIEDRERDRRNRGPVMEKLPGRGNYYARLIDRYVGITAILALGAFQRRRKLPSTPQHIGLLNSAAVGDTILMSGPVADLHAHHPDARITIVSGPSNYDTACLVAYVDSVVKLPIFKPASSLRLIRAQQCDLLLDFGPWCRLNAVLATLSGARCVVGFRTPGEVRHFGYDLVAEHSCNVHELENHRRLVRALGIQAYHPPSLRHHIGLPNLKSKSIHEPYVVCHLWPGGSAARQKEWPVERWVTLAECFSRHGYRVAFTGSANQYALNEAVIVRLAPSLRPLARNVAGVALIETLRVLANATLTVSVDTGIAHMAGALDAPLVALYGPSKAERWGPVGKRTVIVESPLASAGYLNLGFETPRNPPPCMEAISYESVRAACENLLQTTNVENVSA
jgi:lipopolysaccharide heptosyltransferase III